MWIMEELDSGKVGEGFRVLGLFRVLVLGLGF